MLTAMNGVPWWFFEGFGGAYAGSALASVDPDGSIGAAIPAGHVVGCVVHAACSTPAPGIVRHDFGNSLIIGEPRGGRNAARRRARGDADRCRLRRHRLAAHPARHLVQAVGQHDDESGVGDHRRDDATGCSTIRWSIASCLSVMAEASAIATAIGCPIAQSGEDRHAITRKLGAVKTSMLQDVEAGRAVELDALLTVAAGDRRARRRADAEYRRAARPDSPVRAHARAVSGLTYRTAGLTTPKTTDVP